jgi:subtilisin family serine protease
MLHQDEVWADGQSMVVGHADGARAVVIEINLSAGPEPDQVLRRFIEAYLDRLPGTRRPERLSVQYVRAMLTRREFQRLTGDDPPGNPLLPLILRVWPDYVLHAHVDRSISTVKADAANRTYGTGGAGVVWAVIDSGICGDHPHFAGGTLTDPVVASLHRDFTYLVRDEPAPETFDPADALTDLSGHGTHVAAIIAGSAPAAPPPQIACQEWVPRQGEDLVQWSTRTLEANRTLSGIAPLALLVSLRVLTENETTSSSAVIRALDYVRELNAGGTNLRVHGVNLSLGLTYPPQEYAAGQSPLCREVNLLVGTGVVVVVSAGNNGLATADPFANGGDPRGSLSTITDPGNAEKAITVGSTHRVSPHTYGVSFFSSKGPTLDGRPKPDLVAPGERITSAAVAGFRERSGDLAKLSDRDPCYIEDSGTSQAAPHVSGAIAAFLSVRPEFKGQPDWVKKRICASATPLGRHQFFEGAGLLDLMRLLSDV